MMSKNRYQSIKSFSGTLKSYGKFVSFLAMSVLIISCNKVSFVSNAPDLGPTDGSSSAVVNPVASPAKILAPAVMSGIMGGSDAVPDSMLTDLSAPAIVWQSAEGAVTYKVSIFDSTNTKAICAEQSVLENSISYANDKTCGLADKTKYFVRLSAFDDVGASVETEPFMFDVLVGGIPVIPLPPLQKVTSCQTITTVEIEQAIPIQTVVVPQIQPNPWGAYPVIPYAGDSATVNQLCKDLGCGDYVTSTGRGYTSPGNNSVVRFNSTTAVYQIIGARSLNNKVQTLSCTPYDTVKIAGSCNGGFCAAGKLVTRNGKTLTYDSGADLANANKACQAAGYPSAYGLWYDPANSNYWALERDTYSWNAATNVWDKQTACYECVVSKEFICRKN
jgi:hypothetical protein